MKIIIIIILFAFIFYKTQKSYYTKRNTLTTFVVRLKSGTIHYIDLPEKTTRDELVNSVVHMGGKEEDIIGIYNLFGEELEYVEGLWWEK
jgi:hypothetical protein